MMTSVAVVTTSLTMESSVASPRGSGCPKMSGGLCL